MVKRNVESLIFNLFFSCVCIILIFVSSIKYINEDSDNNPWIHHWLSASTIKYTNYWLKDGIVEDKFVCLEKPLSIESQTIDEREPYVSYPVGTTLFTYLIAKIAGYEQIDLRFIKNVDISLYLFDALFIGIIIFLILEYILALKSRMGKITLTILLSTLWILLPNNGYFLKNTLFADQMVLFFIYLFLLLELLKNYTGITNSKTQIIINSLMCLTILGGVLVDYYFWIQVFIVYIINFAVLLSEKKKFVYSLKKTVVYSMPTLVGFGLFALQLTCINGGWSLLFSRAKERIGQIGILTSGYLHDILLHIYHVYSFGGLFLFGVFTSTLLALTLFFFVKKYDINRLYLRFSIITIVPAFLQLILLSNHSAVHSISIQKLGFPFVIGFLLIAYGFCLLSKQTINWELQKKINGRKRTVNVYVLLVIASLVSFVAFSKFISKISAYYEMQIASCAYDHGTYKLGLLVKEMNEYENIFFSFTDSIPANPPMSLALSNKLVYKIGSLSDIDCVFPLLDDKAQQMIIINTDVSKNDYIMAEEQYVREHFEPIKEKEGYAVYRKTCEVFH